MFGTVVLANMGHLNHRLLKGIVETALADFPIGKEGIRIADAPQLQAFQASGLKPSSYNKLCTSPADINNEPTSFVIGQ